MRLDARVPVLAVLLGASAVLSPAYAHSGGLDFFGCHWDHQLNSYHCHEGAYTGKSYRSEEEFTRERRQSESTGQPRNDGQLQDRSPPYENWGESTDDWRPGERQEKAPLAGWTGLVVVIADGDTIDVLRDGRPVKVRIASIDTPERGQPWGKRAKQATAELAFKKQVRVLPKEVDRYGRTVADVFLPSGHSLGQVLVANGLAWYYREYSSETLLGKLERSARAAGKGLWADPNPVPPWEWRKKGGQ